MLLRNVLAAFLGDLPSERALDLPFMSLLHEMGFFEVHFTHGQAEFGKDFIARRHEPDGDVQYAFQTKCGDVNQPQWRNEIQGQMLEAAVSGLSHPAFDTSIPRRSVLVLSGRLTGNAPVAFQDFNHQLRQLRCAPAECWDRERLIELFIEHGPDAVYGTDARDVRTYGKFFAAYGEAARGAFPAHEIERHSRAWAHAKGLFIGGLEAELLVGACSKAGRSYESLVCLLGFARACMCAAHAGDSASKGKEVLAVCMTRINELANDYLLGVERALSEESNDFFSAVGGDGRVASYPAECARAFEIAALVFFLGNEAQRGRATATLMALAREPGTAHPLSDRSAVSLVLGVLALCVAGHRTLANDLLANATVWVADRYEQGFGLAEFDADPDRELAVLFGYPFDRVQVKPIRSSFIATALCDLAAFLGDNAVYQDVVNEFLAVEIAFSYWQVRDTDGQFHIDGQDVLQYPNIEYESDPGTFSDRRFASHIADEEPSFRLATELGPAPFAVLMLLLRDRYFPSLWPLFATQGEELPVPSVS